MSYTAVSINGGEDGAETIENVFEHAQVATERGDFRLTGRAAFRGPPKFEGSD